MQTEFDLKGDFFQDVYANVIQFTDKYLKDVNIDVDNCYISLYDADIITKTDPKSLNIEYIPDYWLKCKVTIREFHDDVSKWNFIFDCVSNFNIFGKVVVTSSKFIKGQFEPVKSEDIILYKDSNKLSKLRIV